MYNSEASWAFALMSRLSLCTLTIYGVWYTFYFENFEGQFALTWRQNHCTEDPMLMLYTFKLIRIPGVNFDLRGA